MAYRVGVDIGGTFIARMSRKIAAKSYSERASCASRTTRTSELIGSIGYVSKRID